MEWHDPITLLLNANLPAKAQLFQVYKDMCDICFTIAPVLKYENVFHITLQN